MNFSTIWDRLSSSVLDDTDVINVVAGGALVGLSCDLVAGAPFFRRFFPKFRNLAALNGRNNRTLISRFLSILSPQAKALDMRQNNDLEVRFKFRLLEHWWNTIVIIIDSFCGQMINDINLISVNSAMLTEFRALGRAS
jgi:hypothetical protein